MASMSSQRVLAVIVLINILIGLVCGIWTSQNPTDEINRQIDLYNQYETKATSGDDLFTGLDNDNLVGDITIGNSISWGKLLWDILSGGINPLSISASDFTHPVEQAGAYVLTYAKYAQHTNAQTAQQQQHYQTPSTAT